MGKVARVFSTLLKVHFLHRLPVSSVQMHQVELHFRGPAGTRWSLYAPQMSRQKDSSPKEQPLHRLSRHAVHLIWIPLVGLISDTMCTRAGAIWVCGLLVLPLFYLSAQKPALPQALFPVSSELRCPCSGLFFQIIPSAQRFTKASSPYWLQGFLHHTDSLLMYCLLTNVLSFSGKYVRSLHHLEPIPQICVLKNSSDD